MAAHRGESGDDKDVGVVVVVVVVMWWWCGVREYSDNDTLLLS